MTTATRSEFDLGIALTGHPEEAGRYEAELGAGWQIGGGVNGGLLLAVAGHALSLEHGQHPDPVSISGYYLSASTPGPATVRTEVLRTGRGLSTGTASLSQDGVERLRVVASHGDLGTVDGEVRTSATPPQLPPPDQCIGV